MGQVRRSFLPTFQGAPQTVTKMESGLSEEQLKKLSADEIKAMRPSQVQVPGTKEVFTPMRHVLAVDRESRAAEIPTQLKTGLKMSEIPKERLENAMNALLAHMQSVPEMYWPMSYRKGKSVTVFTTRGSFVVDQSKIVQHFLSKQPGLKEVDYANGRLPFYRKTYPAMFNFTQVSKNTT